MVTKTLALLGGIIYSGLGVFALFAQDNTVVGANGYFTANTTLAVAMIAVGLVLVVASSASVAATRTWDVLVGTLLILAAVAGFALAPAGGYLYGFLLSMTDNWLNVIAGLALLLAGLFDGDTNENSVRVQRRIINELLVLN